MTAKRLGIIFKVYTVTKLRYKLDVIEQTSQLKVFFFLTMKYLNCTVPNYYAL